MTCPNFHNENLGRARPQIQICLNPKYILLATTRIISGLPHDSVVAQQGLNQLGTGNEWGAFFQ